MRQSLQALTPIETPCIQTISGSECANAGCVCGSLRVLLLWRSLKRACVCVCACMFAPVRLCVCVGVRDYVAYANRPPETTVVRGTQVTQVEPNLPSLSYGKHRPAPRPATNAAKR